MECIVDYVVFQVHVTDAGDAHSTDVVFGIPCCSIKEECKVADITRGGHTSGRSGLEYGSKGSLTAEDVPSGERSAFTS